MLCVTKLTYLISHTSLTTWIRASLSKGHSTTSRSLLSTRPCHDSLLPFKICRSQTCGYLPGTLSAPPLPSLIFCAPIRSATFLHPSSVSLSAPQPPLMKRIQISSSSSRITASGSKTLRQLILISLRRLEASKDLNTCESSKLFILLLSVSLSHLRTGTLAALTVVSQQMKSLGWVLERSLFIEMLEIKSSALISMSSPPSNSR